MKRMTIILGCVILALLLSGCSNGTKREEYPANGLMTIVDSTSRYTIYVHDETGVMYFCRDGGYGRSVCVMVDTDGYPLIWDQDKR